MARSGSNLAAAEVHVELDRGSPTPVHVQLESALREAIRTGRLVADSVLPPTRRFAEQLGVSRGVVVEAYQQLTAEGYLTAQTGGYTRVASAVASAPRPAAAAPPPPAGRSIQLRYGRPDLAQFPRAAWVRAVREVFVSAPNDRLNYLDGHGAPELRSALAGYLNRVRGTWATPDEVVVTNGFAGAQSLLFPILAERGVRRIAVEDPCDPDGRELAGAAGLEVVPIPVTSQGIDTEAVVRAEVQAVLVTPAHQFPTGGVLSAEHRARLVAWARETGGLVIEDDYDAEYRYDSAPIGAIQGLARDAVVYAGTASKTLAPGLRLGWMLAPADLADAIADRKMRVDRGAPVVDQLAFARFLELGEFDRHLRRMRPVYRRRRDVLLEELA